MNWDAIGAVGEVFGACAVVATLAYLAKQIHQSTKLGRATSQRDVNSAFLATIDRIREDPEVFQRGCAEFQTMSRKDQLTFDILIAPLIVHLDQAVRMHKDGLEAEENVETYGTVCVAIIQAPGTRYWYEKTKPFFPQEAKNYIEKRLSDPELSTPAFVDVLPWHRPDPVAERESA